MFFLYKILGLHLWELQSDLQAIVGGGTPAGAGWCRSAANAATPQQLLPSLLATGSSICLQ